MQADRQTAGRTAAGAQRADFSGSRLTWSRVLGLVLLLLLPLPVRAAAELEIVRPQSSPSEVSTERVSIVGRTDPGVVTTATVGGVEVPVYRTGFFVRDGIPLQMGKNSIPVSVAAADGTQRAERVVVVSRTEPPPPENAPLPSSPLVIDSKSLQPSENLALQAGDLLEVSFRGASGNRAEFQIDGLSWMPMEEVRDPATGAATGQYRATITMPALPGSASSEATSQPITFRLNPPGEASSDSSRTTSVLAQSPGRVAYWGTGGPVRLLRVSDTRGMLRYGLTEVRLGGPYLAELPQGTILRAVGRRGPNYKVQLTPGLTAWIHASEVEPAPAGTPVPHLEFTGLIVNATEEGDVIQIPYASPVPFAVSSEVSGRDNTPALNIDLFGAHQAVTWLTHRNGKRVIEQISAEQFSTDHLRLKAQLKLPRLWGYRTEVTTSALRIIVRRAPDLAAPPASPLAGLTVAVNAGHGGPRDAGARGLTGAREADITLAISRLLADQLTSAGAKVIQTRPRDEAVPLSRRAELTLQADADLFVSVHVNSGGTTNGYLVTSGTSTLYKHPFNHDLAETVRRRIVERTNLMSFGTVGNFNYGPVRMLTWMPAILVETAFISNPQEESRLTDPTFHAEMAIAIREGLEEYLSGERELLPK